MRASACDLRKLQKQCVCYAFNKHRSECVTQYQSSAAAATGEPNLLFTLASAHFALFLSPFLFFSLQLILTFTLPSKPLAFLLWLSTTCWLPFSLSPPHCILGFSCSRIGFNKKFRRAVGPNGVMMTRKEELAKRARLAFKPVTRIWNKRYILLSVRHLLHPFQKIFRLLVTQCLCKNVLKNALFQNWYLLVQDEINFQTLNLQRFFGLVKTLSICCQAVIIIV